LLDGTDTEHAADAYGNQLNNELKGNKYANYLWGGAGNDTLYGSKAADVTGGGDGVTNKDALAIQRLMLGLIDSLPEK
ncbi:MAG: hypothetical protein J6M07_00210, partial [Ruminococcus sp.]|nr:hypothetical protein [Ruminococcus sp.]